MVYLSKGYTNRKEEESRPILLTVSRLFAKFNLPFKNQRVVKRAKDIVFGPIFIEVQKYVSNRKKS